MTLDYFSQKQVVESMTHDHLFIWLEMLAAVKEYLKPGCRVLDYGCSSGELLQILFQGVKGLFEPVKPTLAVGVELETMQDVLLMATARTPSNLPILFSHAPLNAFPCQFDLIVSHEVIYLLADLDGTFESAYTALRPGAVFCAATAGYVENEYYQRWSPKFKERNIRVFDYSKETYIESLKNVGFDSVEHRRLLLTEETYTRWRSERPFNDLEWFESDEDERRYFTQVGKILFIGRKGPLHPPDV